jgi:hypothetical protein
LQAERPHPPASERSASPILVVVVDTEEEFDWTAPFDRRNTSVEHMRSIGKLQRVFDEASIVPVYVVDHPIATQATSIEPLRRFREDGRCEIGAHLHPWVSPPFEEEVNARNSYPGNLPRALERAKIASLANAIEKSFGARPVIYKAGRYGAGPNTAEILEEEGFEIDLSPCPPFDFGADGGPDWSTAPCEPYLIGPNGRVLAIPNTGTYVGFAWSRAHALYRFATAPSLRWARLPGILARIGAVERLFLSPEGYALDDLKRLTRFLLARGIRTFTLSLHSPSILPGCTPYVRSAAELEKFLDTTRRYFEFFLDEIDGETRTATELRRDLATTSKKAPA